MNSMNMKKQNGFTLFEVLLTIVLITIGFTALMQAISAGFFAGGQNENSLVAVNLAQEKMEEIRNKSYANVVNEAKSAVSGFSVFQREVAVTAAQAGLKEVSVKVYWFAKQDELNVNLVTYVSDI